MKNLFTLATCIVLTLGSVTSCNFYDPEVTIDDLSGGWVCQNCASNDVVYSDLSLRSDGWFFYQAPEDSLDPGLLWSLFPERGKWSIETHNERTFIRFECDHSELAGEWCVIGFRKQGRVDGLTLSRNNKRFEYKSRW